MRALYSNPELYSLLRPPDPEFLKIAEDLIGHTLDRPLQKLVDPACGSGDVLLHFAKAGIYTAGNDRSPQMCARARERLSRYGSEIVLGDMRHLRFVSAPFDAAVEISGVVSELKPDDLSAHISSVMEILRPRGVYIMAVMHSDHEYSVPTRSVCHATRVELSQEEWWSLTYQIDRFDKVHRQLSMRRTVQCCHRKVIEEEYALRIYTTSELLSVVMKAPIELVTIMPSGESRKEVTAPEAIAVLRRK